MPIRTKVKPGVDPSEEVGNEMKIVGSPADILTTFYDDITQTQWALEILATMMREMGMVTKTTYVEMSIFTLSKLIGELIEDVPSLSERDEGLHARFVERLGKHVESTRRVTAAELNARDAMEESFLGVPPKPVA